MKLLALDAAAGGAVDGENVNGAVPLLAPPNPNGFISPDPPNENVTGGVLVVVVEVVAGTGEPNEKVVGGAVEAAAAGGEAPKVNVDDPPKPKGFALSEVAGDVVVLVPNANTGADGLVLAGAEDAPKDIAPNTPAVVETAGEAEATGGADGEPKENAGTALVPVVAALLSLAGEGVAPKVKAGVCVVLPKPKGFVVSVVGDVPNVKGVDPKSPPLFAAVELVVTVVAAGAEDSPFCWLRASSPYAQGTHIAHLSLPPLQ